MSITIGTVIQAGDAKYQVVDEIGRGGFGVVFRALQIEPAPAEIAIKVPAEHVLHHPVWSRKFEREARILANVSHRNVVRIIGFWKFKDGGMALAQEMVQGAAELAAFVASSPDAAPSLFLQALYALNAIHGTGGRSAAIHRDISPHNLLVDGDGILKLIDFGLAKEDPRETTVLTQAGEWFGTRGCMAPEQTDGCADVDGRADLYSLGRTMAAVLQGRNPLHADPGRLDSPWFEICTALTEHERDERCQNAFEAMELAFSEFASAGTELTDFRLHVEEMQLTTAPSSWAASCQVCVDSISDIEQQDVETLMLLSSEVFADQAFDAASLLDKLEASSAIQDVEEFINFDRLDPIGKLYTALYSSLDPQRRVECFRRVARLAIRGHRYALMGNVRSIFQLERDSAMLGTLLKELDEIDPDRVVEGRGVILGRVP